MFPTGGKKRGCAFENPEPSSPKVTCIGQVRVKTKKQGKKMRTRSKRRGEASFRKTEQSLQGTINAGQEHNHQSHESHQGGFQFQNQQQQECLPHRNQRWVHLPLTICEALRAFGAEFNCFLPCRSSCMTSDKDKEEKGVRSENGSSCGTVFARWLVALQDGDEKGREIELVVGEEERTERSFSRSRRQVFEGIDIKEESKEVVEEEEEARVSVCIPPKNALLLMRCRSDPVKMAALANRFWESPAPKDEDEEEEEDGDEDEGHGSKEAAKDELKAEAEDTELIIKRDSVCENLVPEMEEHKEPERVANFVMREEAEEVEELAEEVVENSESTESSELDVLHEEIEEVEGVEAAEVEEEAEEEEEEGQKLDVNQQQSEVEEEGVLNVPLCEILGADVSDNVEDGENAAEVVLRVNEYDHESPAEEGREERELEVEEEKRASFSMSSSAHVQSEQQEAAADEDDKAKAEVEVAEGSTEEEEEEEDEAHQASEPDDPNIPELENPVLSDCLLMMMCEPKVSMEVSKETWVRSTDFVRWLPERKVNQKNGLDELKKHQHLQQQIRCETRSAQAPNQVRQPTMQPPRSSCSFPVPAAPGSMATIIEEKLVGSKAYEPFVLTRCKSEPMRSSAKFAAEPCFWKNRKLEPHRPATLGVGAAGVGF